MPQQLKNAMAGQLGLLDPGAERLTDEQLAECARAAARLAGERLDRIEVLGRQFRITRLERLMRLGPDGPEPPRPSDWDPEQPWDAQAPPDGNDGPEQAVEG